MISTPNLSKRKRISVLMPKKFWNQRNQEKTCYNIVRLFGPKIISVRFKAVILLCRITAFLYIYYHVIHSKLKKY